MTTADEQIVLSLLRRLLAESYWDTEGNEERRRFLVDGSIYDVPADELDALERWIDLGSA